MSSPHTVSLSGAALTTLAPALGAAPAVAAQATDDIRGGTAVTQQEHDSSWPFLGAVLWTVSGSTSECTGTQIADSWPRCT